MRLLILLISFLISQVADSQIISASPPYRVRASAGCVPDADAQAFITATGISGTEATAICNLVKALKDNSLWSSMTAIYPFVGSSAASQKFNLKDPDDDDASYRLTFTGTITHSSNGAAWDGSTGYANTHLSPAAFGINDIHLSYYSRTNNTTNATDIGCFDGVSLTRILLYASGNNYSSLNDFSFPTFAVTNTALYEITSRITNVDIQTYQNGSIVTRSGGAAASTSIPNYNIYIGALNNANTAQEFSNRQCAFATIGTGLSSGQAATLNTIVEAFQDALGRGVQ